MTAMSAAIPGPGRMSLVAVDPNANYIDLGTEPPLTTGSSAVGLPARRAVSMRWLGGTILTGLTSFVLIGGALMAALNGQQVVATAPQPADFSTVSPGLANGEKGDRIALVAAPPATREVLPVATMVQEGDRELIQQRDFVLVRTALTTTNTDSIVIPDYDPITIVGEAAEPDAAPSLAVPAGGFAPGDVEGGNAALETIAFPVNGAEIRRPEVDAAEIEEIVHRNASSFQSGILPFGAIAYANAVGLDFTDRGADPFAALGVRMIPENVSYLGKTGSAGASREERVVSLGDQTLEEVLAGASMTPENIQIVLDVFDSLIDRSELGADNRVRIATGSGPIGSAVLRISIYENDVHQATVARDDTGRFVRADEPPPLTNLVTTEAEPRPQAGALPRLYEALYLTAHDQGVPEEQINEFIRIFAFDLDMQARIGPTDSLTLFYSGGDTQGEGAILFASVTSAGNTTSYYRFQGDDGVVRYYDASGRSADNFLLRKPVANGELRSTFGYRLHPILGVNRLHSGVDYAAPYGTPIVAAGDGVVVRKEWSSGGYGNFTVVQHSNGYETAYAHQSGFAQGLDIGDTVRQGQVIGYVGSTGLSTGNHLHFEIRINGQPVNPLTIRLPEGDVLAGDQLLAFEEQRDQVNELLGLDENGVRVAGR